jgi:hypothetical protein
VVIVVSRVTPWRAVYVIRHRRRHLQRSIWNLLEVLVLALFLPDTTEISSSARQPESANSLSTSKAMKRAESGAPKSDRRGKRQRQGRDTWTSTPSRVGQLGITGETIEASIVGEGERKERLAKRKCAVLVGFCGTGYSGMQLSVSFLPHICTTILLRVNFAL